MDYTKIILNDYYCNYLDADEENANMMLFSCINKDRNIKNFSNGSINTNGLKIVEGFKVDNGPGESYIPKGECPMSFARSNGNCIKVCNNCNYTDKSYNKSFSMNEFNPCGMDANYIGIDKNGYIQCNYKQTNEKKDINNEKLNIYLADSTLILTD